MKVEIEKLVSFNSFSKMIGTSVTWIDKLSKSDSITTIRIDNVKFVLLDDKTNNYALKYAKR